MTLGFDGDPKLYIGPDGADLNFSGGQPEMDTGYNNHVLISLFTAPGWGGNYLFVDPGQKIGSDFEETLNSPITARSMNTIRQSALNAIGNDTGSVSAGVVISNPAGQQINVTVDIHGDETTVKTQAGMII
jgi:hypothetical protein